MLADTNVAAPARTEIQEGILRALLYFDIWEYPLTLEELRTFLPVTVSDEAELLEALREPAHGFDVRRHGSYVSVSRRTGDIVERRRRREEHAMRLWRGARIAAALIRRFPFVRAVFVSGDLSMNSTSRESDADFFILTEPGRLWIARTLLILFKKLVLLNRKKFWCLNSFRTVDHLVYSERNIYCAAEIAHVKPLANTTLFESFLTANSWILTFFPNFRPELPGRQLIGDRKSILQAALEAVLGLFPLDRIDALLMNKMRMVWERRYPQFDREALERMYLCTPQESRAYGRDFQGKVLDLYRRKLEQYGIES
jgi:hypothetical protein